MKKKTETNPEPYRHTEGFGEDPVEDFMNVISRISVMCWLVLVVCLLFIAL